MGDSGLRSLYALLIYICPTQGQVLNAPVVCVKEQEIR